MGDSLEKWKYDNLTGKLRYEIAEKKDHDLILRFLDDHFRTREPLQMALGTTSEEIREQYDAVLPIVLDKATSILGFDGDDLVSICLNSIHVQDENLRSQVDALARRSEIETDYTEAIKNGPYKSKKANIIRVFLEEMEKHLPSHIKEAFSIDIVVVKPSHKK